MDCTKSSSEWINVKDHLLNLHYGQIMTPRLAAKFNAPIRQELKDLPSQLVSPRNFLVSL